jgi:hypothetical protein
MSIIPSMQEVEVEGSLSKAAWAKAYDPIGKIKQKFLGMGGK